MDTRNLVIWSVQGMTILLAVGSHILFWRRRTFPHFLQMAGGTVLALWIIIAEICLDPIHGLSTMPFHGISERVARLVDCAQTLAAVCFAIGYIMMASGRPNEVSDATSGSETKPSARQD